MSKDNTTVVSLAFPVSHVRRRGGLVIHPRVGMCEWTVSTEMGFSIGGVCFDEIEQADEFAKRVARFKRPWRTMTLGQWDAIRPALGQRIADIALELGWKP